MSRRRRLEWYTGPANGHARRGSRGTRANSKIFRGLRVISVQRLEELLRLARASDDAR